MSLENYFLFAWGFAVVYVILGNYLYFVKVLRGLAESGRNAAPSLLPSIQFKQIDDYLKLVEKKGERPWFYFCLRHIRMITLAILLLLAPVLLKPFGLF